MAGKAKAKVKEEIKISKINIDDILLRLDQAEETVADSVNKIDDFDLDGLTKRVEKVEARLGIG